MKFSKKALKTLEFDVIKQMLSECALTDGAKAMALELMPSEHITIVLRN